MQNLVNFWSKNLYNSEYLIFFRDSPVLHMFLNHCGSHLWWLVSATDHLQILWCVFHLLSHLLHLLPYKKNTIHNAMYILKVMVKCLTLLLHNRWKGHDRTLTCKNKMFTKKIFASTLYILIITKDWINIDI